MGDLYAEAPDRGDRQQGIVEVELAVLDAAFDHIGKQAPAFFTQAHRGRGQFGVKGVQLTVGDDRQERIVGVEQHMGAYQGGQLPGGAVRLGVGGGLGQPGPHLLVTDAHQLGQHMPLGGVVRVQSRGVDADHARDLPDRGAGETGLGEQFQAGLQNPPARPGRCDAVGQDRRHGDDPARFPCGKVHGCS